MTGLLLAALFGLYRQWWVPGWSYRAVVTERDFWRGVALKGLGTTDKALTIAESKAERSG